MVEEATKLLKEKAPDLPVVGSIQFDAAWSPTVAATKAKGNDVAGHVNVFVFPDLCAGNIGYKPCSAPPAPWPSARCCRVSTSR